MVGYGHRESLLSNRLVSLQLFHYELMYITP